MKALSGVDGAFPHLETPDTPMHVGSLHVFAPAPGGHFAADVKRHMARRLHLAPVYRRQLAAMPLDLANPVWVDADAVDLDRHVQHVKLPAPGTHAQLEAMAARLHSEPLDRSRPLWRMVVIEGLANGDVGLYVQIHHAVLDGQAAVLLARTMFDTTARPRALPRAPAASTPGEHPGIGALAVAALRHDAAQYLDLVRHSPDVVRTLAGLVAGPKAAGAGAGAGLHFAPKTSLNVPITGERGFAAESIPLDALKRIAAAHDAKLNDVVLALCSGVLRRYLDGHGGVPREPLVAAMPISLRAPGNEEFTTEATMTLVGLATHLADPVARLHAIRDGASAAKATMRRAKGVLRTDFPTIGVPWVMKAGAWLYGRLHLADTVPPVANVVVSNVAGPTTPLYFAGARMRTYWPMSIVEHGLGLNVTVESYAGAMGFGFTTARSAVPDARAFTTALRAAVDELAAASSTRRVAAPARRKSPRTAAHAG